MAFRFPVGVVDLERAVVQGMTEALRMHGVDVPDPDGERSARYVPFFHASPLHFCQEDVESRARLWYPHSIFTGENSTPNPE